MTKCIIAKQIAEHCNEPEQNTAADIYQKLLVGDTYINYELYELSDITEALIEDSELLLNAVQDSITDNPLAIHTLYINKIQEIME